jgi:hypothetical protein
MPLITVDGFRDDIFAPLDDDAPLPDGAVLVSLSRFQAERDALIARNAPIGVRLKSDQSPEQLGEIVHRLSLVALEFPKFRDGCAPGWTSKARSARLAIFCTTRSPISGAWVSTHGKSLTASRTTTCIARWVKSAISTSLPLTGEKPYARCAPPPDRGRAWSQPQRT